jgi:ABC-type sugar transport system permease subunit
MLQKSKVGRIRWKYIKPLLFILPALLLYSVFVLNSIAQTVQFSFLDWDGINPIRTFVGFDNFIRMFRDPIFWGALRNNIIWILVTIFVPTTLGLMLALLLARERTRFVTVFRTGFFVPAVISIVVTSLVWQWIFLPEFGILNTILRSIGLESLTRGWLGSPDTVLGALLTAGSWTHYGFCMVIVLAAVQSIDKTYYEVSKLEGAGFFQDMRYVTLPLIKHAITLLILHSMIGSFQVFDLVFITTRGGPFHSSEVLATYMYRQAFFLHDVGFGAAISLVLAIMACTATIVYLKIVERRD